MVHCPKRALVKMKWASFEEEHDNIEKARDILMKLNTQYPLLLECNMQLIDIERRLGNMEAAQEFYKKLTKKVPSNRKNIKTWLAMKFSRFQFKVCGQPDKALATLRSALKKERAEVKLYAQIIDICYQRQVWPLTPSHFFCKKNHIDFSREQINDTSWGVRIELFFAPINSPVLSSEALFEKLRTSCALLLELRRAPSECRLS